MQTAIKAIIHALPADQFTQAWKCIEEITAALQKAGPTALIAAEYCRAVHNTHVSRTLSGQQERIRVLTAEYSSTARNLADARDLVDKQAAKIARLKAKQKSKK